MGTCGKKKVNAGFMRKISYLAPRVGALGSAFTSAAEPPRLPGAARCARTSARMQAAQPLLEIMRGNRQPGPDPLSGPLPTSPSYVASVQAVSEPVQQTCLHASSELPLPEPASDASLPRPLPEPAAPARPRCADPLRPMRWLRVVPLPPSMANG